MCTYTGTALLTAVLVRACQSLFFEWVMYPLLFLPFYFESTVDVLPQSPLQRLEYRTSIFTNLKGASHEILPPVTYLVSISIESPSIIARMGPGVDVRAGAK